MKSIIWFVLLFCGLNLCNAQEKIEISNANFVTVNGKILRKSEIQELLKLDRTAYTKFQKANSTATIGNILLGGAAGAAVGHTAAALLITHTINPEVYYLYGGVGLAGVALKLIAGNQKKKAYNLYNEKVSENQVNIILNENGAGIAINF